MAATNEQVQQFVDDRIRPWCESARAILLLADDHRAAMDDVYANLSDSPDWTDEHDGHPPHLATPADVLAINTAMAALQKFRDGTATVQDVADFAAQWPIVLKLCVRAPLG